MVTDDHLRRDDHGNLWLTIATPHLLDAMRHPVCMIGDLSTGPNCGDPPAYRIRLDPLPGWEPPEAPGMFACPRHTAVLRAQRRDVAEVRSL